MGNRRKTFFNCLLMAVIVLSIIVATKNTVILNIPIACSFFVFPIAYLALITINDLCGAKEAILSLLSATGVLIIIYGLITLVLNLPNQVQTINAANALNYVLGEVQDAYYVANLKVVFGSVVGLLVSGFALIGIYTSAHKYTFKSITCFLATLVGLLLFNAIYVASTQIGVLDSHDLIMMMLNRFIFCVVWTVLITILFMIFSHHKKVDVKEEVVEQRIESEPIKEEKPKSKKTTTKENTSSKTTNKKSNKKTGK